MEPATLDETTETEAPTETDAQRDQRLRRETQEIRKASEAKAEAEEAEAEKELTGIEIEFTIDGVECGIDAFALDYGELDEAERFFGQPYRRLSFEDLLGSARGELLLGYLARKRVDPDWTLEQSKALNPGQVEVREVRPIEIQGGDGAKGSSASTASGRGS